MVRVEDAGLCGGFVGGVGENVPAAEDYFVELFERDELLDERGAALGALAQADGAELRERAGGMRNAFPHQLNTCAKRRTDGTHAVRQTAELALGLGKRGSCARAERP